MTTSTSSSATGTLTPAAELGAIGDRVGALDQRLWPAVGDGELVEGIVAVVALKARLAALEAGLLAEVAARDLARKQLHWGSTSDWFTHVAGLTRREGRRAVAQAGLLVSERRATLDALRRGATSPTQAGVICDALERLPGSRELRAEGERVLLEESLRLDATDLTRAGRHLAEVIDPDRVERRLEAELAREERAAHADRFLAITDDGAGGVRLTGRASVEDAAVLKAALLPLTKPEPSLDPLDPASTGPTPSGPTPSSQTDPRDHGARLWDGLVRLAQHSLDTDLQPASHGARPRLSVLIDVDALQRGLAGAGVTDDGLTLSAAAVRRLACDADVLPVCLTGAARSSTSGAPHASSPHLCGGRWWHAIVSAASRAATAHR